jgi:hypothetical protein
MALAAQAADRQTQLAAQLPQVLTAAGAQLDPLAVLPDRFVRVQLRRISRQVLQVQPGRRPRREEALDVRLRWMLAPSHSTSSLPRICRMTYRRNATTSGPYSARSCSWTTSRPSGVIALMTDR